MKTPAKILLMAAIGIMFSFCVGCGQTSDSGITLDKPSYRGQTEEGKPEFTLTWNRYPDAGGYEMAIFAEGEDDYGRGHFAIRSTKNVYGNTTKGTLVFLQGISTDTVTYRVKVRPTIAVDSLKDSSNDIWSNLWEIRFEKGKYSVRATDKDFDDSGSDTASDQNDADAGKANEGAAGMTEAVDNSPTSQPGLRHVFPESLTDYLAKEAGKEAGSLGENNIAKLMIGLDDISYGEPRQTITDEKIIQLFNQAISAVQVTGRMDDITSNPSSFVYNGLDKEGKEILKFSIKDGLLIGPDGRYSLEGLDTLYNIDGIIGQKPWTSFLEDRTAKMNNYDQEMTSKEGSLIETAGYTIHELSLLGPDAILYVSGSLDENTNAGPFSLEDKKDAAAIWKALSDMKVGKERKDAQGEPWHLIFRYQVGKKAFCESARLDFLGNYVKIGGSYYETEGLDALFDSYSSDMFSYLKEFGKAEKIEPVY